MKEEAKHMATLDQVEKLRERANVSYDEAKAALDAVNGDLLEALIYLEKQGRVRPPEGDGYYSSSAAGADPGREPGYRSPDRGQSGGEGFGALLRRFGKFCLKVIRKGNENAFEVYKDGETKASFSVTALVLLLIFAFWVTIPLLIIGLFFGLRYRFQGPDLGGNAVNGAMDSVADATDDFKRSISEEKK